MVNRAQRQSHSRMKAGDDGSSEESLITRLAKQDVVPWYRKPNLRRLYFFMIPTCLGVEWTSGFDTSLMNGLQAVPAWDAYFGHPRSATLGFISSVYQLGVIVALPFVVFVADRYGRRSAINFGSALVIMGALMQTAAQNLTVFIVARFIMGLGIPFSIVGASSLVGELSYPTERPVLGSLFSTSYYVGAMAASGTTLATFAMQSDMAWRIPSFLQIVPSALQLIFMPFLPESPRWLVAQGRREEALAVLIKYHGEDAPSQDNYIELSRSDLARTEDWEGASPEAHFFPGNVRANVAYGDDEDDTGGHAVSSESREEFARAEFAEIERTLELDMKNTETSWWTVTRTWGMRRRLLICTFLGVASQWSGNGLISYFLARILEEVGIHDDKTKNRINFGLSIYSLMNGTFCAVFVHRFRRRSAFLMCTISLFVVVSGWTIASAGYANTGDTRWGKAVIFLMFVYNNAYAMGFGALPYTFLVELFPFSSRAHGIMVYQWAGRSASFVGQLVNPIGIAFAGWKFYIFYVAFVAFEVVFVYFMFPETSGRTLEELAFLYEEDQMRTAQESMAGNELAEERRELVAADLDLIQVDAIDLLIHKRNRTGDRIVSPGT